MNTVAAHSDHLGLIGVCIILLSYYLLNIGRLASTSMWYLVPNLIGSLLILISLLYNWNLPAVVIESTWALISMIGILRIKRLNH